MNEKIISGIQQIGIGIPDAYKAWKWYRKYFGMDIKVFDEEAVAELMLHYTNGKPRKRHAILAMNMQGGGGFEIWKHTEHIPQKPTFEIQIGDYGIFASKMKTENLERAYNYYKKEQLQLLSDIQVEPSGKKHFFVKDPYDNIFQIVESDYIFSKKVKSYTGGCYGAIIGVSDVEKSLTLYNDILGYDEVVYDKTEVFEDFKSLPGGGISCRRVLLKHNKARTGAFSRLLGPSQIELVEVKDRAAQPIYKDRIWGDLGYIHLCFDVVGIKALREECTQKNMPFTVDSSETFDMEAAGGHFGYISDPDGLPIEFVETHKVPILKKIGWYINLKKRDPKRPLPNWLLKSMAINRVKD